MLIVDSTMLMVDDKSFVLTLTEKHILMFSGSGKTDQGLSGSDQGDVASGTKQNEFLEGFFFIKMLIFCCTNSKPHLDSL